VLYIVYFTSGFEADTKFFPALKHPILINLRCDFGLTLV
jgi:hypothetical protein